eukprot:CAMPEP_0171138308 /NCGR_PEP_ID=MMETSP0766_2-20121228/134859_1 /TAXON_ID=439317 /ORGANISM="Gambierdiscus australes, Strain CAWD 149" /LENGTH=91 /DNA_ID=CAMNT_0011601917 /DNA_START=322 /DNA_END=597 /DNA_ORIENTATION=-
MDKPGAQEDSQQVICEAARRHHDGKHSLEADESHAAEANSRTTGLLLIPVEHHGLLRAEPFNAAVMVRSPASPRGMGEDVAHHHDVFKDLQ